MQAYGRDWSRLHSAVPAKTLTQIKNYYQNYRTRLGLDKLALPPSAVQPGSRKRKGGGGGSGGEKGGSVAWHVLFADHGCVHRAARSCTPHSKKACRCATERQLNINR